MVIKINLHCLYGRGQFSMAVRNVPPTLSVHFAASAFKSDGEFANEYLVVNVILIFIISIFFLAVGRATRQPTEEEFSVGKQREHVGPRGTVRIN